MKKSLNLSLGIIEMKGKKKPKDMSEEERELYRKLDNVTASLVSKLKEKELPVDEFSRYLFSQLRTQGILEGNYFQNARNVGRFHQMFDRKLNITEKVGLKDTYCVLDTISKEALKDIKAFEDLEKEVKRYAAQRGMLTSEELADFVNKKVPFLPILRRFALIGRLTAQLEGDNLLVEEKEKEMMGKYERRLIEKYFKS